MQGTVRAGRGDALDRLAAGLYAWFVTVALPCTQAGTPLAARLCALTAIVALGCGALLSNAAPLVARLMGVWLFLGACLGVWGLHSSGVAAARLDPVQGALGALGWALYALAWAGERPLGAGGTLRAGPGQPLPGGEGRAPVALPAVALAAGAAALVPMLVAWWVPGVERSLFGHGAALAIAIALLTATARLLVREPGPPREDTPAPVAVRMASAFSMLLALSLLLLAGAALRLLR